MQIIHLVVKCQGEYDDYRETALRAFVDPVAAEWFVSKQVATDEDTVLSENT